MTIDEIVRNKDVLMAQKKAAIKNADGIMGSTFAPQLEKVVTVRKEITDGNSESNTLIAKLAINTTNILDSHGDVHIKGLWNKSLKENKMIMHLQEHQLNFDKIIADGNDLEASTKNMTFKELGYNFEGETQVLMFDSKIRKERNPYMFDQYKDGHVKNHSVGMRYVKLALAVNDEKYPEEKKVWDKYYPVIANKSDADAQGYFWAVTEAKVIEGSAVPIGSNRVTPTMEIQEAAKNGTSRNNDEPPEGTQSELKRKIIINQIKNFQI